MILVFTVLMLFGWITLFWDIATAAIVCAYISSVPCLIGLVQLLKEEPRDDA